ncbi:MAG: sulfatase [Verrucomicrobiales bacterium]|nr:sulfatase [Verrucomicrobiales bacterium]
MTRSLLAPLFASLLTPLVTLPGMAKDPRPNFVVIFIDDMGYGDIGPFGSEVNQTPHLDRMAEEGMRLTSFYAAPVCSASRAQLLTGSYAPRVSVPGVFFPAGEKGLNPEEITIADYLKRADYATGCFGKWHLGDQREFLPTRQGFDTYFGIPYSNDMARKSIETGLAVHPLMRDEEPAELITDEQQRRITREYTEEAIQFIEQNQENPFFVYLPHTAMHVPLYPHPDFVGISENGTYGDWIAEVDWSVGQILETLRKLKLEKNTLVWFTSDNGPWASKGKAGGVSGPLRGAKGGTFEGGVRVPTIAWWPGKISPGSDSSAISGTTDLLPTFAGLTGVKLDQDRKIDGKDLAPLLLGETEESPHEIWHYFQGTRLKAVRSGPWKLALEGQSIGMGFRSQPEDVKRPGRLYHLENDLGETTDVSEQNPEVVARLRKLAEPILAELGNRGPGVRPPGVVKNPVMLYPAEARNRSGSKKSGKPIDWKKLKNGDTVSPADLPNIGGETIAMELVVSGDLTDGVLLAHGGLSVGYTIYLKDGSVVLAIRRDRETVDRIQAPRPDSQSCRILARISKKEGASLQINEAQPVSNPAIKPIRSHPMEELSLGFDSQNPVDSAAPSKKWEGTIDSVKFQVETK